MLRGGLLSFDGISAVEFIIVVLFGRREEHVVEPSALTFF